MLADVLLVSGQTRDGVQLLGAAQAARSRHALPGPPSNDDDSEHALAAARQVLGVEETDRAWAEGLVMTITDTIAFAQDQRA